MMQQGHTLRARTTTLVWLDILAGVAVLAAHSLGMVVGANHEEGELGDAQGSLN
jgi:hypothetical protein